MRTPRSLVLALLGFVVVAGALTTVAVQLERRAGARAERPTGKGELDVAAALAGFDADDAGFTRARTPRPFDFPRDHGAHDGFRTEWWYVTGNLFAADGRAFGVQLTFFRNALAPAAPEPPAAGIARSRWRNPHLWMAHFALSDERGGTFRFAERFAREAVGLAGVTAAPFRVALEDWSLAESGESGESAALARGGASGTELPPLRLRARDDGFAVDLVLVATKPLVLQGDRGLSQKGPEPGNASHYYSLTRLVSRGTVTLDGESVPVSGESWIDREWSTSALGGALAGWDWLALQLADGRELMFYRLRRKDGATDPWSRGSLVAADGKARSLLADDVRWTPLTHWRSPAGVIYPAKWRLEIPGEGLDLELTPRVANQELAVTVRYWEGAMRVEGRSHGRPIAGHGFVEMTGYAPPPAPGN